MFCPFFAPCTQKKPVAQAEMLDMTGFLNRFILLRL